MRERPAVQVGVREDLSLLLQRDDELGGEQGVGLVSYRVCFTQTSRSKEHRSFLRRDAIAARSARARAMVLGLRA